jgi:hypothetical protein
MTITQVEATETTRVVEVFVPAGTPSTFLQRVEAATEMLSKDGWKGTVDEVTFHDLVARNDPDGDTYRVMFRKEE